MSYNIGYGPFSASALRTGKTWGFSGGAGTGADLGVFVGVTNTTLDDPPCDCGAGAGGGSGW